MYRVPKRGDFMQSQQILFIGKMDATAKEKRHVVLPPRETDLHHDGFAEAMLQDNPI
jgi:hypothetical protein